jgi:hypothetical protein
VRSPGDIATVNLHLPKFIHQLKNGTSDRSGKPN